MKATAIVCVGIQGSGKSTWAKEYCIQTHAVRINNDEIRNAIYERLEHRNWSKQIEAEVRQIREDRIRAYANNKTNIVIDNTHANLRTLRGIIELCESLGYQVELKWFDVNLNDCIRRDSLREGYECVGEDVIRKTYEEYMKTKAAMSKVREKLPDMGMDPNLPLCIIADIDGTLAEMGNRSPYDESKVYEDTVREFVLYTVKALTVHPLTSGKHVKLFIFSGRTDQCETNTRRWLKDKCGFHSSTYTLAMRKSGDRRRDSEVKRDLYNEHVRGKYNVFAVFDDRAQVIRELWAAENLPVFRCGVIDKDDF